MPGLDPSPTTRTASTSSSPGLLGHTPVPLVPRRNAVDAFDGLRVRDDRKRGGLTQDGQRLPVDVVDGVATGVVVRAERDAGAPTPKPRLHFGFPLPRACGQAAG